MLKHLNCISGESLVLVVFSIMKYYYLIFSEASDLFIYLLDQGTLKD